MAEIHISGIWTNVQGPADLSSFRGVGTKKITWGTPVDSETSSYEFEGGTNNIDIDGDAFVLGTFTHHNYRIYAPFERFSVDLQITATVKNGPTRNIIVTFDHYESPNRGPVAAQADVVTLRPLSVEDASRAIQAVKIENIECDMIFEGFYSHDTGELNSIYRSPEDKSNLADIHVRLARYGGER
ncbi:choice-of-anchor K domain-containing protein [Streptomyces hygroscopicus]|uniref:choice-of-anchor K domain-containing protein n=1 Tax=Streptomyces hygroscopicus TaxID=1912 RepID=UPI0033F1D0BC